jgi:hypothetical protein
MAQEWLAHTSTAHAGTYIYAEEYQEKANGVMAGLDLGFASPWKSALPFFKE